MAYKLVWTKLARRDLRGIVQYIARNNPEAARQVGESILVSVELLRENPGLGRKVPERDDESIREIIRGNYRIIYRSAEDPKTIQLWRIWHGARGEPDLQAVS